MVKEVKLVFQPPAVGSGIRTLTFDPDGITGPLEAPLAGDVFLFAPEGEIDAGEAGISGRNVTLGATRVLNAENISFSAASLGVPAPSEGGSSLGSLAGTSGLTEASNMADESAAMSSAQDRFAKYVDELSEALKPKWLDVKVIDYVEEEEVIREDEE
jgi:hypothetical protein